MNVKILCGKLQLCNGIMSQILLTAPSPGESPLFPSLTAKKNVSWKAVALELLRYRDVGDQ